MSPDDKKENTEWRRHAFERKIENKYEIESHHGINFIHGNKGNKLAEYNLLHDILNPPKRTNF